MSQDDDLDPTDVLPPSGRIHESSDDHRADALTEQSVQASRRRSTPDATRARSDRPPPGSHRPTERGLGRLGSDRPPPDEVPTREQETRVRRPKHGTELLGQGPLASPAPPPEALRMRTLAPGEVETRPDTTRRMPRTRDVHGVPVLVPQTLHALEPPKPLPEPPTEPLPTRRAKLFTERIERRHADEPVVGAPAGGEGEGSGARRMLVVALASALAAVLLVVLFLRLRGGEAAPTPQEAAASSTARAPASASPPPRASSGPPASAPGPVSAAPTETATSPSPSATIAPKGPKPTPSARRSGGGGPLVTD